MSRIDEMIQRLCPDGVEYKKLGEVIRPCFGERITKTKAKGTLYPVYGGGGESFRTDNYNREDDYVISRFAISPVNVRKVEGKFWLLDSGFTFEVARDFCDKSYVAQYLFSAQDQIYRCTSSGAQKNLQVKKFLLFEIPVPPLEIQREIVRVLDSFTELKAELEAELEARRIQYAYYRNMMLSHESLENMTGGAVMQRRIGEIASLQLGKMLDSEKNKGEYHEYLACANVQNGYFDTSELKQMRFEDKEIEQYSVQLDDIVVCEGGQPGRCAIWSEESRTVLIQKALHRVRCNRELVIPKYLFFTLQHIFELHSHDDTFTGSTIKHLPARVLKEWLVSVPPLSVQQQVVDILDRFDALTTSLTDGLPAEIEARRKQYEYYRDRLLDFPCKEV